MHLEPARIARGDRLQRRPAALVALHRDDPLGALQEQRAREPAGARPDLDHRLAGERAGSPAMRRVRLRSRMKFWPRLLRAEARAAHDLAERRQAVGTLSLIGMPDARGSAAAPARLPAAARR